MSLRWSLNKEDIINWLRNACIFLAPALIIFLQVLQTGGTLNNALIALETWAISVLVDLLRKYASGPPQI